MSGVHTSAQPVDVIGFAFAELVAIFGREFTIIHGEKPDARFRAEVAKLRVDELERGLQVLAGDRARGVPNVSEILACAKHGRRLAFPRPPPAPSTSSVRPASREVVDDYVSRCKSRLGLR